MANDIKHSDQCSVYLPMDRTCDCGAKGAALRDEQQGVAGISPTDPNTDATIGKLDRLLSEFLLLTERPDLDMADAQTLKHHADDLIGVGTKALSVLRRRGAA